MFCSKCGAHNEDGRSFCTNCGAQLKTAGSTPNPAPTPEPTPVAAPIQPQVPYQVPSVPGKGLGITAMVLGIVSLVLFCIWYLAIPCAIVGAALGGVALSKAKAYGMKNGMAVAGVATSCVALGLAILFIVLAMIGIAGMGGFYY